MKNKTLVALKTDSMPHTAKAPTNKPKGKKAELVGRLAKRNYTRAKAHPIHGLNGTAPKSSSSASDVYLS